MQSRRGISSSKILGVILIPMVVLLLLGSYNFTNAVDLPLKINEVELNPQGPVTHNQWLELHNEGSDILNVGGWLLKSTKFGKTFVIPHGFVIRPHDFLVIPFHSLMFELANESVVLLTRDFVEVDRTPDLSDTSDDNRTWQRFPNGADTNSPGDWNFMDATGGRSNGILVTAPKFMLSQPKFVDTQGNSISGLTIGHMMGIRSEITNELEEERTFTYIVKVTDRNGYTKLMSWVEDITVLPFKAIKPTIFWLAKDKGNYKVEVFVWRSLNIPEVFAPSQSSLLRIAG
jgi:hypothetical protein